MSNDPALTIQCPACGVAPGARCITPIDGADVGWTHDARALAPIAADLATR